MNNTSTSTTKIIGAIIVIIALAALAYLTFGSSGTSSPVATVATSTAGEIATTSIDGIVVPKGQSIVKDPISYSIKIATSTFSQNQPISITFGIHNDGDTAKQFNFKDGCQVTYQVADFDSQTHTRCTPEPTAITVGPHQLANIIVTHYPSVYKIPVGKQTLTASLSGYGNVSLPITITP